MVDQMNGPITRCPWCSAELSIPGAETCESCGAALVSASGADQEIRGVTTLDPEAIIRGKSDPPRQRNRILSFITGDTESAAVEPVDLDAIAPPDNAVRREMLRLQLEAERADLEAETVALKSDVLAQHGIPLGELDEAEAEHAAVQDADQELPQGETPPPPAGPTPTA
jgi:hypothetical protein